MAELAREHGFGLFVVVFPFAGQYREDYLERDRDYVLMPQRRMTAICEDLGVPLLDLYPLLDPSTDLSEDGIHLTRTRRAKTAGLIHAFLKDERLLPTRRR